MQIIVTPTGSGPITINAQRQGWYRVTDDIGFMYIPGLGARFVTARGGEYRIRIVEYGWDHSGYLPPRAILTIRPDSPAPTLGLLRPHGDVSDFGGASGLEIDACGSGSSVHEHDALMQRSPLGLYNMANGRPLKRAEIHLEVGYYRLDRGPNKTTVVANYFRKAPNADQYDDNRVPLDATPITDLELRESVLAWWAYNGQHLIRLFRVALMFLTDAFVQMDIQAANLDAALAWDDAREELNVDHFRGIGSPDVGREFAWVSYLATIAKNVELEDRQSAIAGAVQRRDTKVMQRLTFGIFNSGSPNPWGAIAMGGSGVPQDVEVAQDLEAYATVTALYQLGLNRNAGQLASSVLRTPLKKWIAVHGSQAQGVGVHGVAYDQAWPALGIWALRGDRAAAFTAMTKWQIPTQQGGALGPFTNLTQVRTALLSWGAIGKTRWALQALTAS